MILGGGNARGGIVNTEQPRGIYVKDFNEAFNFE
nr:MAG TPA: hypothetical protein [Caudoviricetes sp.]